MLRLTDRQREAVVNYFYDSETAYLVDLLMMYLPEDMIRGMAERLTQDDEEGV